VELSKYVGFCLEDGRKFRLNEVFEIEVNVDLDLLSVSDLTRPIYFNDGTIYAG
jgi:hypothetical protein